MNKIIIFIFCCLIIPSCSFAQTPANDPHWQLKWYDEFDTFNPNKWFVAHNEIAGPNTKEPQLYRAEQVWVENGNLVIVVNNTKTPCPIPPPQNYICDTCIGGKIYDYKSGCISTKKDNYTQFGYIEARIKFPFVRKNNKSWGFWPAFWTHIRWNAPPSSNAAEIDIVEIFGGNNKEANTILTCIHRGYPSWDPPLNINDADKGIFHEFSNFSYTDWHTYAVEWNANRIIWYVDGKAIRTFSNHEIVDPIRIILNLAIQKETKHHPPTSPPFQEEMRVDYVRIHKLICDKTTISEISNFNTYNYAVKKSISLSNATTIPANSNIFLRATDFIELKPGFEVQTGRELYLDVTPCEVANSVIYSRE